jgi:hypothetical protein
VITIKPIETVFYGYRFRSRLEARWAVFFDALGITWEYEPEGFELSDGTWYLPDFWLPTFDGGMWAEVKPPAGDFKKAILFSHDTHQAMWLCEGTPTVRCYQYLSFDPDTGEEYEYGVGIPNALEAEHENRMYGGPGFENDDLSIPLEEHHNLGYTFRCAVEAARSARFDAADVYQLEARAASGFYAARVKVLRDAAHAEAWRRLEAMGYVAPERIA